MSHGVGRFVTVSIISIVILLMNFAVILASSSGRVGVTLKDTTTGCATGGCHGNTSANSSVVVTISGPDTLSPGQLGIYGIKIVHNNGTCGIDIAVSSGTLDIINASSPLKKLSSELTHSFALTQATSYQFKYTAPLSEGTVTIYAAGKSTGNAWGHATNKTVVVTNSPHTNINDSNDGIPNKMVLYENYPNPFNPVTTIRYSLPHNATVVLEVYDVRGKKYTTLVDAKQEAGYHTVEFDGTSLPSGVYFYRLTTDKSSLIKKLLLLK